MNIIPIGELYALDYSLTVINGLKQYWKNVNSFSCLRKPKKVNILVYLDGLKAEYTDKNGEKKYAGPGDIVYTPIGCEYLVHFYDMEKDGYTIGVNFLICDEKQTPFIFSDDILIFRAPQNADYKKLFSKVDLSSEAAITCHGKMKAGMYDVISMLSELYRAKKQGKFDIIMKGISYLESNSDAGTSLAEIARLCNVSTSYFRRLFREYAGVSPKEYIMNNRLEKAMLYLEYENMTVSEIAERLNFTDTAYFSKQFRHKSGMTPNEYRKLTRAKAYP